MQDHGETAQATAATPYAWYALAVLTAANLVSAVDRFIVGIVMIPIKASLSLSDTQLGALAGLGFAVLYCLAGLPVGLLADRVDRRRLIGIGCTIWTLATASCAFAGSFPVLMGARLLVGLGEAMLTPTAISLIGSYFPRARAGLANGIWWGGSTVGKAVAFIGGGALLAAVSARGGWTFAGHRFEAWQCLFLMAATPGFLIALLTFRLREPARRAPEGTVRATLAGPLAHMGRHRLAFVTQFISGACTVGTVNVFAAWAPTFFYRRFGLEVSQAALIVGLIALLAGPLATALAGQAVDAILRRGRHGAAVLVLMAIYLLVVPFAAYTFAFSSVLNWAIAGFFVTQSLAYMAGPQAFVAVQLMTPKHYHGTVMAIFMAATTLVSMGLMPTLIGLFSDRVFAGSANPLGNSVAFAVGLMGVIGLACSLLGKRLVEAAAAEVAGADHAAAAGPRGDFAPA